MEEKRKVVFTLEGTSMQNFEKLGVHDYDSEEERVYATKQRIGYVHAWGLTPNGDNVLTCGIVEDLEDGQVYCVPPENIKFEH